MRNILPLFLSLVFFGGCVSFSRHADLLADTKPGLLRGTCANTRYQNSVEIKKNGLKVQSDRFVESSAFGIIVPFQFTKSEKVVFSFTNFNAAKFPKFNANQMRLIVGDREIKPNPIDVKKEFYKIEFPVETLKNIHEVTLKISTDVEIVYVTDTGWFFMPILVPHSNGCSGTDSI